MQHWYAMPSLLFQPGATALEPLVDGVTAAPFASMVAPPGLSLQGATIYAVPPSLPYRPSSLFANPARTAQMHHRSRRWLDRGIGFAVGRLPGDPHRRHPALMIDSTAGQKSDSTARSSGRVQITVSLQRHQRDLAPLRTLRSTLDPSACGAAIGTPIDGLVQDERTRREFIERLLDDHGDDLQGDVATRPQIESTVDGHGLAVPWWFIAHPDYRIGQGFLVPVIRAPAVAAPRGMLGGYRAHLRGVRMVRLSDAAAASGSMARPAPAAAVRRCCRGCRQSSGSSSSCTVTYTLR